MNRPLLGGLSPRAFLRRHWQKRPLLVRRAWRPAAGLPSLARLRTLALRCDVESRLVRRRGARWSVEHGPLDRSSLRALPARNWSLLVNGIDHHCPAAAQLMGEFDFLPQARLEDVMVSYAAPGGGVGPHFDSYDVFLLQGTGRRVWRLARPRGFTLLPGAPLRLIAGFAADEEYLLEAGDLLYLPPGWGHDGVALDPCWTYSVGCRAPHGQELALALLDELHERGLPQARYRDPGLRPASRRGAIAGRMIRYARDTLARVRWSGTDALRVLGKQLTAPRPQTVFRPPRSPLSRKQFRRHLASCDAVLDARSKLLYRGRNFFFNGEFLAVRTPQAAALAKLADERRLRGRAAIRGGLTAQLHAWHRSGELRLERRP